MEIDVSKCKYKYEDSRTLYDNKCIYITDCRYKQLQQLKAENEKYLQCLDEIEEIINNFADEDIITLPDLSKEKNYKLIAEQYANPIKQIIQKIKEVKGNDN